MDMLEALRLCKDGGHKVRPVVWRFINPHCWVEARPSGSLMVFVEAGHPQEMVHSLRLRCDTEFLGEWETVE